MHSANVDNVGETLKMYPDNYSPYMNLIQHKSRNMVLTYSKTS